MSLPLSGIRVLDLSRLLPGGFCSLLLADFGAEVLKVEDTGAGDYIRWAPPYYEGADDSAKSAMFLSLNRNKRSIRIDLKSEAGREVLLRLVRDHDVVLESFRPGVLDRLGVGYERMREQNPGIVYCAISGYGQSGPKRDASGHDMNYLGLIGLLGLTGERDGVGGHGVGGHPIQSAGQIADLGGGALMAAFGIMAALRERDGAPVRPGFQSSSSTHPALARPSQSSSSRPALARGEPAERTGSGEGQFVDVSMADGALSWLAMVAGSYFADGVVPHRGEQMLAGSVICYRPYECSDGWVTLGALEPKFWQAWCRGTGHEQLIEKQFERPGSKAHEQVCDIFRSRTRAEWAQFATEHDCCLEPVLDLDEALDSELVREREMVVTLDQPGVEGGVRQLGVPVKLDRTPGEHNRLPGPGLGEHTEEVLRAAGYSDKQVAELLEQGAVAGQSEAAKPSEGGRPPKGDTQRAHGRQDSFLA
jgi:crotonobetainyl-CoA:carnitine CoA-transferase CaiB-like acyl-CoA transferase